MKHAFKKVADIFGNGRYIKIDGSSYRSTGLTRLAQRPENKVMLGYAGLLVAGNMIAQGSADMFTERMALTLFECATDILIVNTIHLLFVDQHQKSMDSAEKAIDTEGRDLSQTQISAKDYGLLISEKIGDLISQPYLSVSPIYGQQRRCLCQQPVLDMQVIIWRGHGVLINS